MTKGERGTRELFGIFRALRLRRTAIVFVVFFHRIILYSAELFCSLPNYSVHRIIWPPYHNLDDEDEDEEEDEESEEEESGGGGLAALYNADLPSEDEEDGAYDSNEEPEGSDGADDDDEIIQPQEGNDEGAGSSW